MEQGEILPFLVGVQACTVTLEINFHSGNVRKLGLNLLQERTNYTALGHKPKGCSMTLQGHLLIHIAKCVIQPDFDIFLSLLV